mgnify:CR=1 FL=1
MHYFLRVLGIISSLVFIISYPANAAHEKLIFALDLIRHGDRTPFDELPNAPHTWKEGKGQLTALGMQQEYQLGLRLNQRYKLDNQLLPVNYQVNTVYIRSTDVDRTLMSAQSVLMGLYPLGTGPSLPDSNPALPSYFQPIPIHTIPAAQDTAFVIDTRSSDIAAVINKYVYSRADWQEKAAELEPQYLRWSQLTGVPIENMLDVISVADTLNTYVIHNIPLPAGLSKEEASTIIENGNWIFATLFKSEQVGDVAGKAALTEIMKYIQQAVQHKTKTKFVLLSTHDVTILAVMSALHIPLDTAPPYASDLNFSVYQSESEDYVVKITYNNKPVNVPGCMENRCSLTQLLTYVGNQYK